MLLNRARADELMDRDGVSAIVATTPVNTYYLSSWATDAGWGFGDLTLAVLPRDHDLQPAVITVEVNVGQPQQREGTWMTTVRGYGRRPGIGPGGFPAPMTAGGIPTNHPTAIAAYLRELGLEGDTIAFEDRGLGADVAAELGGRLKVVAARDLLREIRMVKTPTEIAHIRAATRKTELALLTSAEAIAGGANCADAERVFWSTAALMGGRPVFLLITPYRPKVGRLQKTDALLPGDTVTFDATAEYAHYTSDIGRTAVIGEPNRDQLRCYNATRLGWRAGQAGFRPGAWSKDVEQGVTRCIQEAGNPEFRACGIHSVGLEHTDHPHPNGDASPFHLIDGMVISCDLPWIGPDTGKFHFEDLVYLHDGQVETLNDSDGRLIVCCDGRASRVE